MEDDDGELIRIHEGEEINLNHLGIDAENEEENEMLQEPEVLDKNIIHERDSSFTYEVCTEILFL